MKHTRLLSLLIACCTLPVHAADAPATTPAAAPVAAPAAAPVATKPLAVVNGEAVPGMYANFIRQNRIKRNMPPEALTDEAIKEGAVTAVLLSQEAVKKGLDKDPTVAAALEFQKMELLGRAALEDYLRAHPIKEETVKAEYANAKEKAGETEYRARHILVNSEKEAKDVIAKLNASKKAKFEDLAKKSSKDTSAGNGGDLGWVLPANLVPEFAQTMVGLKKGEVTKNPVQTRFGWHVIRLEETRKLDFPDYEKIKNRIAGQLQQQQIGKLVKELAATAKIE
ncbi:MAG: peptidylprolyl isomerase [Pseudomonadota bacterium]|nr:peptidylprolyl isomerase [Pseudomonadota bacterium]